jgi:putative ABC transport system substrate-binding protein
VKRREFVAGLALQPLLGMTAFAQTPGKVWRVGVLTLRNEADFLASGYREQFLLGMRDLGYIEGRNLAMEYRYADGKVEAMPKLVGELVAANVDILVVAGNQSIAAAQKIAPGLPIVIATAIDPVGSGFAKSLANPGGNITGLSNMTSVIAAKQLEILLSLSPRRSRVAFLENPTNSAHAEVRKTLQAAATSSRVTLIMTQASTPETVVSAFQQMAAGKVDGVIVAIDGFFVGHRREIAALALRHRIASVFTTSPSVAAGGLMSYGQNFSDNYRRAAAFVDKILRGARPGDLPIEQSIRFELAINRTTAKALGIALPPDLLLRADQVIE